MYSSRQVPTICSSRQVPTMCSSRQVPKRGVTTLIYRPFATDLHCMLPLHYF
jgi:hypothetical protein